MNARCTAAALQVSRSAVQLHGAIGYAQECDLSLFYKRTQQRFLPRILRREHVCCQGYSEPNAGSDLAGLRTFAFAKSDLTPAGRTRIDNTLQELKSSGIRLRSISIVGHTDPIGSLEFNQRLSVARANSVRDYLVAQGVPANIISTEGRGPSELKITEAECKAQAKPGTALRLLPASSRTGAWKSAPRASSRPRLRGLARS